jgi:twitching motility two-component system response regulator PilG
MRALHKIRLCHPGKQTPKGPIPEPGLPRPLVMVIDDSPTVRKILETCLAREGYPVVSFADGSTALRWLREPQAQHPRLIFLDLVLPGMPGLSVARSLKKLPQAQEAILVMLTRRSGLIDHLHGRLAGADVYMTKPFRTQEILALASHASERSDRNTAGSRGSSHLQQNYISYDR